jgi:predicted membrane channel-forming protein YqfA (hemolysin III family)
VATKQVIEAVTIIGLYLGDRGWCFLRRGDDVLQDQDDVKFIHLAWHLCVIAGSAAHFLGIYFYVLPLQIG